MAVSFHIELDSAGMREVVSSTWAQRVVDDKAREVAERAESRGIKVDGEPGEVPLPIAVVPAHSKGRARALVVIDHPSGLAVEAKHRLLGGALG